MSEEEENNASQPPKKAQRTAPKSKPVKPQPSKPRK